MYPTSLFSSLFQVTGAPQLLWTRASGVQEDAGEYTEGREGQKGAEWIQPLPLAVVGRVPGTVI